MRTMRVRREEAGQLDLVAEAAQTPVRSVQVIVPAERAAELRALVAQWMADWARKRRVAAERARAQAMAESQGRLFDE